MRHGLEFIEESVGRNVVSETAPQRHIAKCILTRCWIETVRRRRLDSHLPLVDPQRGSCGAVMFEDILTHDIRANAMTNPAILEKLTPLLRDVFYDEELVATPDLTAQKVHGWDSLGHVRLLAEVELAFAVRFNAMEISSLRNVGQLVELIEKKRPPQRS